MQDLFMVFIAVCALILGVATGLAINHRYNEISPNRYQNLIGVPAKYVQPHMEDGKITNREYEEIVKAYSKDEFNRTQETNNGI